MSEPRKDTDKYEVNVYPISDYFILKILLKSGYSQFCFALDDNANRKCLYQNV